MPLPATLITDLQSLLPPAAVIADPAHLPAYGTDFWAPRGVPGVVVRPQSSADVCTTLRFATAHGLPVVPRAAGTNIGAGFLPAPDRLLLDLRALNRVLAIDVERREAVVEPGVLNGTLQAHLAPFGLCFSPDPASAPIATIGGNIAENAGGPHCLKYGVTVHHVTSLACALPDGTLVRFSADDPGPDLRGVLIGSEGTLGVVTEATLRLRPLPAVTHTLLAVFDHAEAATAAVSATLAAGILPAALEFFDQAAARLFEAFAPSGYPTDAAALLLVDLEGSAADVAQERPRVEAVLARYAREIRRAEDAGARAALWCGRLQAGQALQASGWDYVICDTTVPRSAIPAMQQAATAIAQQQGVRLLTQGHAGDGNIHPVLLYHRQDAQQVAAVHAAADALIAAALALGGTLTGEHGVGSEKRHYMPVRFSAVELAAQRAVKAAFDPAGLLNPDVLLPAAGPDEPALPQFAAAVRALVALRRSGARWHAPPLARPAPRPPDPLPDDVVVDRETLTVRADARLPVNRLHAVLTMHNLVCMLARQPASDVTIGELLGGDRERGALRDRLLAVQVTLPDGDRAQFGSRVLKDVAGYDLKRLYHGSGATFGRVEEVTLTVRPEPAGAPGGTGQP